jgi:hypothetical protein
MKKKKILILTGIIIIICTFSLILMITVFSSSGFHETKIILDDNSNSLTSSKTINAKEHIGILPEYSTDVSIGYQNADGTKTLDVFACPIAYKDKDGQLSMIDSRITNVSDNTLRQDGYIYTIANSDIKPYYPKELTNNTGILVSNGFSYIFGVINDEGTYADYKDEINFIGESKKMIVYKNALGDGTELRNYPTALGSNCEIILNKKPADNKLTFWLKLYDNPVNVSVVSGGYLLMTKEITDSNGNMTNKILGIIQSPLVKDSSTQSNTNLNFNYNNTLSLLKSSDGSYKLTMTLNVNYLNSKTTKYPLTVFSSFEQFKDKEADSAIYSNIPDLNSYLSGYTILGNSNDYGIGRIFIRYKFAKVFNLKSDQIIQTDYFTYNLSNNNIRDDFEVMSVLEDWCSLTRKWSELKK